MAAISKLLCQLKKWVTKGRDNAPHADHADEGHMDDFCQRVTVQGLGTKREKALVPEGWVTEEAPEESASEP